MIEHDSSVPLRHTNFSGLAEEELDVQITRMQRLRVMVDVQVAFAFFTSWLGFSKGL